MYFLFLSMNYYLVYDRCVHLNSNSFLYIGAITQVILRDMFIANGKEKSRRIKKVKEKNYMKIDTDSFIG